MKKILAVAVLVAIAIPASAQVSVDGYYKKNGTYVAPYERTSPNSTTLDNYSTKGNVNPYTGQEGTRNPYPTPQPQIYSPQPIQPVAPVNPYLNPAQGNNWNR